MAAVAAVVSQPVTQRSWLYGPVWDLMLGCGGLYFAIFWILFATGPRILDVATIGVVPLILLFTSVPHYGATLLRVYERREDRRAYAIFSLWATVVIWALFVVGVYNLTVGCWLVTLFLTWSPWHYSGQNYGIGLMLLGRGGVRVPPLAKRFIWLSFVFSWLMVVFTTHGSLPGGNYTPTPVSLTDSVYRFIPLQIPFAIVQPLLIGTTLAYVASLLGAFSLLRREASWRELAPLVGVIGLQGAWFSIPVVCRATGVLQGVMPLSVQYQGYLLVWVALGHSLQYLWVTTYFATKTRPDARRSTYWVKTFFAGAALFAVPVFLFSPDGLGVYSFESGLGVLIAAAVNLHHFVLDGAIWRLRDGRIARILLRRTEGAVAGPAPVGPRPWSRGVVWGLIGAAGAAYAVFYTVGMFEIEYGFRRVLDPPNLARLQTAARRLAWVGHDHPGLHLNLAVLAFRDGDLDGARREAERSIALGPNVQAWMVLGQVDRKLQDWDKALADYEAALQLDPNYVPALGQAASVGVKLGRMDRAELALARAVQLAPERRELRQRLEQVRQQRVAGEASALEPPSDDLTGHPSLPGNAAY